ncbi:ABC transporter ATP-binding protein [Clostridium sp. LIBA-8841]|uniref:ABC transporter ATP-binding protein n=1 Tax=Clostridium sp. LIBA-8841 TaxID=2987530 RepID=UPI002AC37844|nr:ABC transporter ATP-binding protein [Clostridium sp. LIBA-8841]MDZ5254333.1 ABC transporter ATP-binding protein/permease [Clostridium sp. LIBA-8841]
MSKLIKYLKPFTASILAVIVLLFAQAMFDLSLPDYMSNIVNVGIQQGGIENAVPKVISQSEFDKLTLFISKDEKKKVESNYILLDKNTLSQSDYDKYIKDYPALENEAIYKLNTKDKDVINELNPIMGKAIIIVGGIEEKGLQGLMENSGQTGASENAPANMEAKAPTGNQMKGLPANTDPFFMIKNMPEAQKNDMLKQINDKFADMPESMITQTAASFIKTQYTDLGMSVENIQSQYILRTGGIMVLLALGSMVAAVAVTLIASRVAAGFGKNLRGMVFGKVVRFSNAEFDKFSTASLITRSTNDIQQIQTLMVMLLRIVFYAPILGLGGIFRVVKTDTGMSWIIAVALAAILSLVIVMFGLAIPKFKLVQKLVDKLNLVARESLTGMLVIRAFNTEKYQEDKFDGVNKDLTKTNLFVNRIMGGMMPLMMLIMNLITVLIVWVGAHNVNDGVMQVGDMMAFIQYTMQIIMAFLMISMVSVMLPRASVSGQRIAEVLDTDESIKDPEKKGEFDESKRGYVEFKDVSFKYPGAEEYILKDISFTAKPGKTTAFIGGTGSGKSTLVNLIPRFYDVTEGEILVDGTDIRNVSQHDLRDKIGYVPQKGVLFSGTIESNLKYGDEDALLEDLEEAANIAQASEFINTKALKYAEEISQGGTNVSGGQKQRLSIARALVKKPDVYIFDDSFSALDFKTDAAVRKSLNEKTSHSTMLIVAQRISTIMGADQIIVLDEGKIVGKGTHKELLENCEVYKQIALSQLSKEELGNE